MNKDGWNQKENTAGCSRQDSLRELWFLYLGKIGVGEARCNEDGAKKKAGAQQRGKKRTERSQVFSQAWPNKNCSTRQAGLPFGNAGPSWLSHLSSMVV